MELAPSKTPSPPREGGVRKKAPVKKMRQRSCFECRRGKRKCIYLSGSPGLCTQCAMRGIECIDHEPVESSSASGSRNVLRQRVARLEQIIETVMDQNTASPTSEPGSTITDGTLDFDYNYNITPHDAYASEYSAGSPVPGLMTPNVAAMYSARGSGTCIVPRQQMGLPAQVEELNISYDTSSIDKSEELDSSLASKKDEWARQRLRDSITSPEKLLEGLDYNRAWWLRVSSLILDQAGRPGLKSVHTYCKWSFQFGSPMDVAKIVHMVVSVSEEQEALHMLRTIDEVIMSDESYLATHNGLEVGLMQSRYYMDIGMSKKAWLTNRKVVDNALLINLHRHRTNLRQNILWRSIFQADRFMSLVVGAPYSIPNVYCNLNNEGPKVIASFDFITRLALITGKVIDRAQGICEATLASLFAVDDEMMAVKNAMPRNFWNLEDLAPQEQDKAEKWSMGAGAQICFFHTRLILHLPSMVKSLSRDGFEQSRTICLDSAREILKLFRKMRLDDNERVYKNKSIDFTAFVAAVVLIVALMANKKNVIEPKQAIEDWGMVNYTKAVMEKAATRQFGKIAHHSFIAMEQLIRFRNGSQEATLDAATRIIVPFLGTIEVSNRDPEEEKVVQKVEEQTPQMYEGPGFGVPPNLYQPQREAFPHIPFDPNASFGNYNHPSDLYTPTAFATSTLGQNISIGQFPSNAYGWEGVGPYDYEHSQEWEWPGNM